MINAARRSQPLADDPSVDLSVNTTSHLIADIELLREQLQIAKWQGLGFSWGTTLALAYAESFPERVAGLAPGHRASPRFEDPAFRYRFARLVTHCGATGRSFPKANSSPTPRSSTGSPAP